MSGNPSEEEPSIEEILASIRQIISDDDDNNKQDADDEIDDDVVEDPIRHKNNDVLELTEDDLVQAPAEDAGGFEIDMIDHDDDEDEEEYVEDEDEEEDADDILEQIRSTPRQPAPVPSEILSSGTQAATLSSLGKLTKKMPINSTRSYDGVTLEDIVRELLHPMLREWMDDNLPPMVERIVQKELEKLARRAMDD